jgi:hypothetical protein
MTDYGLAELLASQEAELALLSAPRGSIPPAARAKLARKIRRPSVEVPSLPEETAAERRARLWRESRPPARYLAISGELGRLRVENAALREQLAAARSASSSPSKVVQHPSFQCASE